MSTVLNMECIYLTSICPFQFHFMWVVCEIIFKLSGAGYMNCCITGILLSDPDLETPHSKTKLPSKPHPI